MGLQVEAFMRIGLETCDADADDCELLAAGKAFEAEPFCVNIL